MKIRFVLFIGLFMSGCHCYTQSVSQFQSIPALQIGDTVPNIELGLKFNAETGKTSRVRVADFKGKLLVLDLLHTGCKACMEALPAFRELQLNNTKFNILSVTNEGTDEINGWFSRTKKNRKYYPEFIVHDSLLKQYFPHKVISHLVWIDPKGIIAAITDKFYLTQENINLIMKGEPVNWPVKKEIEEFNSSVPLMQFNQQVPGEFNVSCYSVVAPYFNGVFSQMAMQVDSAKKLQRITWFNRSIIDLYLYANDTGRDFPHSQIVLRVKNKDHYFFDPVKSFYRSWCVDNQYCYETVLPLHISPSTRMERIRSDLDNKFGLRVRMDKMEVDCYALIVSEKPSAAVSILSDSDFIRTRPKNYTQISSFIYEMNKSSGHRPVLNETNFTETHYFPGTLSSVHVPEVNVLLASTGLQLVPVKRVLPMLVIEEPGSF